MAAIIAFFCVVAGVFICIFSEASIVGGVVSFGGVATIVAVFLKYTSITMELGNSEKKKCLDNISIIISVQRSGVTTSFFLFYIFVYTFV